MTMIGVKMLQKTSLLFCQSISTRYSWSSSTNSIIETPPRSICLIIVWILRIQSLCCSPVHGLGWGNLDQRHQSKHQYFKLQVESLLVTWNINLLHMEENIYFPEISVIFWRSLFSCFMLRVTLIRCDTVIRSRYPNSQKLSSKPPCY